MNKKSLIAFLALISSIKAESNLDSSVESNITEHNLKPIIASGNPLTNNRFNLPGNASIITKKDIDLRPNGTFSDTLRGFEGVRQSKSRGMNTFDSLTLRGISNGTIIMLDGVILNDINNNTKMMITMSADDLEQVEVIRGPFSNLYGSGALGGAINFVTQMPDKFEAKAKIGYGNPFEANTAQENLVRGYFSIGDTFFNKRLKLKASYGFVTTNGYAADSAWVKPNDSILTNATGFINSTDIDGNARVIVGDNGKQNYQTHDLRVKGVLNLESSDLNFGLSYNNYIYKHRNQKSYLKDNNGNTIWGDNSNTNNGSIARPLPIIFGYNIGKEQFHQIIANIGYKKYFLDSSFNARYSFMYGYDNFANPNGKNGDITQSNNNTTMQGGNGQQTITNYFINNFDSFLNTPFDLGITKHEVMAGVHIRHLSTNITINNVSNWSDYNSNIDSVYRKVRGNSFNLGAFVELRSKWLDSLSSTISGRYDFWLGHGFSFMQTGVTNLPIKDNNKSLFSPKATLNYQPHKIIVFKTSVGQGFRAPTLGQLTESRLQNDGSRYESNPNLRPESATSFDIGFELSAFDKYTTTLKTYYFHTFLTDTIYQQMTMQNNTKVFKWQNGGTSSINGVELSFRQVLPFNFGAFLTYTWTNSLMITNKLDSSTEGKKLAGIAEHLAYGQIYYDDSRLFGSFGVEFMSKPYAYADNRPTISGVYGSSDSYMIADLRFGYRFTHFELSANVTNLFNDIYYAYYRAPGRAFFISFGARI